MIYIIQMTLYIHVCAMQYCKITKHRQKFMLYEEGTSYTYNER